MNRYSPEQKRAILECLFENGGNVIRTGKQMSVPESSVRLLRNQAAAAAAAIPVVIESDAERWFAASAEAREKGRQAVERIAAETLDDALTLFKIADIAAKNHLNYRDGRIGATINVDARQQSVNYTLQLGEREDTLLLDAGDKNRT